MPKSALYTAEQLSGLVKEDLIQIILDQQDRIGRIEDTQQELTDKVMGLVRASKRQAAPFGKSRKAAKKGSPRKFAVGRPVGHRGSYRKPPVEVADEEVEVPLCRCPVCQGPLSDKRPLDQCIEELPQVRHLLIKLRTWEGKCKNCGPVRSTHPLQVSAAQGAARTHLGARAVQTILELKHEFGLSMRKIASYLATTYGLSITPGGIAQLIKRMGGKLETNYETLRRQAQQASLLHADETGWFVGARAWLWVFTNPDLTLFEVSDNRSVDTLNDFLGEHFTGVMVSDCWWAYETFAVEQQKCYAHHLKLVSEAIELKPRSVVLPRIKAFLQDAIQLKKQRDLVSSRHYWQEVSKLEDRADRLFKTQKGAKGKLILAPPPKGENNYGRTDRQLLMRIARRRSHLLTMLYRDEVPSTNNLAERQLRPAVIDRKLSCGNRTWAGARAWQVIKSLIVTHKQRGEDFGPTVRAALKVQHTLR